VKALSHSWRRRGRRRRSHGTARSPFSFGKLLYLAVALLGLLLPRSTAVLVHFENCLPRSIVDSAQLQFVPLNVSAHFNTSDASHNLSITIYGNVTGSEPTNTQLPSIDDPHWGNPNQTLGKIANLSTSNNKYSTLFANFGVLSYTPYEQRGIRFCDTVVQGKCPLAPVFNLSS
jgi:hypothetical protein